MFRKRSVKNILVLYNMYYQNSLLQNLKKNPNAIFCSQKKHNIIARLSNITGSLNLLHLNRATELVN